MKWIQGTALVVSLALGTGVAVAQAGGASQGGGAQGQAGGSQQSGMGGNPNTPSPMDSMSGMNHGQGGASMQDQMFLRAASEGGLFEVEAGKLALQKSSSDDVKQFAQRMVDDHSKLNEQMAPIAQQAGIKPATELKGKDKKEYAKLQGLSGQQFDTEYLTVMMKAHKQDLSAFKNEASNGQMQQEKQAASQGSSVVDQHLQMLQQLARAHNMSAS